MKISLYTHIIKEGSYSVIYNCRNDAVSVIDSYLAQLLNNGHIDEIERIHPSFFQFLSTYHFIVSDDMSEYDDVVNEWKNQEKGSMSIFINPTMDCNLRCWYCYEEHKKGSRMGEGIKTAIISFVEKSFLNNHIKRLAVSFFGGEPLLAFSHVVKPILEEISSLCQQYGVTLHVGFVTNGSLLLPSVLDYLKSLELSGGLSFQITFDGNREFHNRTKSFSSGKGSYDTILANVKSVATSGFELNIRFNMTDKNLESFYDVLSDLKEIKKKDRLHLSIDFQHIWQDEISSVESFSKRQRQMREAFLSEGFMVSEPKEIDRYRCYADLENHVTVNYNGDLFMCTARDFSSANREGVINPDGSLSWNDRRKRRLRIRFGKAKCRQCRIFPLCHGGCSQDKLESSVKSGCVKGYTESDKRRLIKERVSFLLETINLKQKDNETNEN